MSLWKVLTTLTFVAAVSISSESFAMSQGCGGACASCHSVTVQEASALLKGIGAVKDVKPSPVRGLYEITFEQKGQTGVAYLDYGKKHLIAGQVFDIASRKPVGGSAEMARQERKEHLDPATLTTENTLVFGNPKGKKKLYVFTDPECPFCAKEHVELKKLVAMEPDLAVYIKLFPLKMHPKAYDKSRVILSRKSVELLDQSFAGKALPSATDKDDKKPVDDTIRFAGANGINSTPTLVFQDGRIMPGYRDAQAIRALIAR